MRATNPASIAGFDLSTLSIAVNRNRRRGWKALARALARLAWLVLLAVKLVAAVFLTLLKRLPGEAWAQEGPRDGGQQWIGA